MDKIRIRILDAETLGDDIDLSVFESFGELEIRQRTESGDVASAVSDADVLILNKVKITRETLESAPRLKLVCVAATGYDNVDTAACREKGVAVCNVPGYSTRSVAQLTAAMALSLATHLPEYDAYVKSGRYTASGRANCLTPVVHDLCGMTWGIVGAGAIGQEVGKIAEALGACPIYSRKHPTGENDRHTVDELCERADILSLHAPLSEETRGMIGEERLLKMKKSALLINVSRGALTDENAVAEAVIRGEIGGFGCDVYGKEPLPADHPFTRLYGLPNVILTPHTAWGSHESREKCVAVIKKNIKMFLSGEKLNRIV